MKASTSVCTSYYIEEVACADEETTKEVNLIAGGKFGNKVDKIEEICVASHVDEGTVSGEETLDVSCRSGTSAIEVAVTDSDARLGDGNPIPQKRKD